METKWEALTHTPQVVVERQGVVSLLAIKFMVVEARRGELHFKDNESQIGPHNRIGPVFVPLVES